MNYFLNCCVCAIESVEGKKVFTLFAFLFPFFEERARGGGEKGGIGIEAMAIELSSTDRRGR